MRDVSQIPVRRGAPDGLRRRVIGSVRCEPAPLPSLSRELRRALAGRRARYASFATLLAAAAVLLLALDPTSSMPADLRGASVTTRIPGAHASIRSVGGGAEILLSGMPEPAPGRVYQAWLVRPDRPPQPTDSLFTVTRTGTGAVEVAGSLRDLSEVTVTEEPVGGASVPSEPPLLRIVLGRATRS